MEEFQSNFIYLDEQSSDSEFQKEVSKIEKDLKISKIGKPGIKSAFSKENCSNKSMEECRSYFEKHGYNLYPIGIYKPGAAISLSYYKKLSDDTYMDISLVDDSVLNQNRIRISAHHSKHKNIGYK